MKKIKLIYFISNMAVIICLIISIYSVFLASYKSYTVVNIYKKIEKLKNLEQGYKGLKEQYNAWKNVKVDCNKFLKRRFISIDEFDKFKQDLQKQLENNSLSVFNIKYNLKRMKYKQKRVSIIIKLKGTYTNIKRLIYDFENLDTIVYFSKIDINKCKDELISGTLVMEVYFVS